MNCNLISTKDYPNRCLQIDKRIAHHQSAHAVAICLGNRQKNLPDVYFKILVNRQYNDENLSLPFARRLGNYTAEFEGGRLIQSLPLSFSEAMKTMSQQEQEEYKLAFEADIVNLLVGPLAEAKYVASLDDESFSVNLMNVAALRFYGGNQELGLVTEYMDCFMLNKQDYERKLQELYLTAYHFVNNQANWRAITALVEHILDDESAVCISCEKINSLLQTYLESERKMEALSWPVSLIEKPMAMGRNHLAVTMHGG